MSTPIRFYYQGAVREVTQAAPTQTILQHLREDLHCTGTKEGCAEGDCGACTVVIGTLGADGQVEMKAVNSCIQLTPTLDTLECIGATRRQGQVVIGFAAVS